MVELVVQSLLVSVLLGGLLALLAIPVILGDRAVVRRARRRYYELAVEHQQQQRQQQAQGQEHEVGMGDDDESSHVHVRPIMEQEKVSWSDLLGWGVPEQVWRDLDLLWQLPA